MNPTILALRAISSLYVQDILRPLLVIGCLVYIAVLGIIGWIAYVASPWWWLLGILPSFVFLVALTVWIIAFLIARRIAPAMNKKQKQAAKKFVGRIGNAAEHLATPKFILIFRVIKDVILRPNDDHTFIGDLAREPGEMRHEFNQLRRLFS